MDEAVTLNNAGLFAVHAGNDVALWKLAEGQEVTHTRYGTGRIESAELSSEEIKLSISFEDETRTFHGKALTNAHFFSDMQLPSAMPGLRQTQERLKEERRYQEQLSEQLEKQKEELKEQREKERESAEEFAKLRKKYRTQWHRSSSPSEPLYPILLQIDEGELLNEEEVRWLESHGLYATLAIYEEKEYRRSRDAWMLIRASSYWRRAKEARRAVKASEHLLAEHFASGTPSFRSAVLTTRGGAFRDLDDLDAAERCAREAIDHKRTSHHPYNLLGAIHWQRGEAEEGDECFVRAQELGRIPQYQERKERERALEVAGPQQREAVAKYLLEKNPSKYGWAKRYLQ